jgi:uncharacterized protein YggE
MKPSLVLAAFLLLSPSFLKAEPEITGKPSEISTLLDLKPKTTTISGEAELKIPIEKAVASLRIATEHKLFGEAVRLNNELRSNVASALKKSGLSEEQIRGARFSSTPNYSVFSDKAKSYRVENVVRITVTDDKEFTAVASIVDLFGDVHFAGIEPESGDIAVHKEKALAAALKNADDRRALVEKSTGLTLTPETVSGINVTMGYPDAVRRRYSGSPSDKGFAPSSLGSYRAEESPLAGGMGEVVLNATVSVTYTVSPR